VHTQTRLVETDSGRDCLSSVDGDVRFESKRRFTGMAAAGRSSQPAAKPRVRREKPPDLLIMCTSDPSNMPFIVAELQRLRPRSVLDVGIGFGKVGILVREYLECWYGRYSPSSWQITVEGIEIFEAYRNPMWGSMYDRVHVGDARTLVNNLRSFDVAVCCDVIEHLDKRSGLDLLNRLVDRCGALLLTTPIAFWPQGPENGNAHEVHRSHWGPDDFRGFDGRIVELDSTFGATLTTARGTEAHLVVQRRLDHVGLRPLSRALLRRMSLVLLRRHRDGDLPTPRRQPSDPAPSSPGVAGRE
jgi:SAM-dependent methyltransferase